MRALAVARPTRAPIAGIITVVSERTREAARTQWEQELHSPGVELHAKYEIAMVRPTQVNDAHIAIWTSGLTILTLTGYANRSAATIATGMTLTHSGEKHVPEVVDGKLIPFLQEV
jgi:hypothetical protein